MAATLHPDWSRKMRFFSLLSMLLLVYVHAYNLNERYLQPFTLVSEKMTVTAFFEYLTANGLFRFRIPMLFAISGYLLALGDDKGYLRIIGKRFRTLMLPYFLWSVVGALIAFGLYHWSFSHESVAHIHLQPTNKSWDQFGWREWRDTILSGNVTYQLWFIRSLFFLNLLYPLLRKGIERIPKLLFIFFALLWMLTPLGIPLVEGDGLLPFCLGIWLCKKGKDLSLPPRWFSLPLFFLLFAGLAVLKTWLAFHAGLFPNIYVPGITIWLLHKLVIVSGMLVAWFGSGKLAAYCMRQRWFRHASDQAFMIYALHVPLVTYLIDPVSQLLHRFRLYRLMTYLFLPLNIIVASILFGMLLKAIAAPVFGVLTGNRGLKALPVPALDYTPPLNVITAPPEPATDRIEA